MFISVISFPKTNTNENLENVLADNSQYLKFISGLINCCQEYCYRAKRIQAWFGSCNGENWYFKVAEQIGT